MKKIILLSLGLTFIFLGESCKKCTQCTATDTSGHVYASQKYCSTSSTNLDTFEKAWKTTYGAAASCKRSN